MKKASHRFFTAVLAIALIAWCSLPTYAWGASGHRIVAIIAERHIKPSTRLRIKQILGNVSLASVANYADAVRNSHPETSNFHFVDIPKDETNFDPARDCPPTEKGDCVLAALKRFKTQVVDPQASPSQRRFALKFIIHLMGDMHQPLHCSDDNDRGGNNLKVKWFGSNTNLHKVWDRFIIEEAQLTDAEFADALDEDLTPQQISGMQQGTIQQWALQSHKLAHDFAYKLNKNKDLHDGDELDDQYYERNAPVVDQQLLRGGLRLARVLDWLFSPPPNNSGNPIN